MYTLKKIYYMYLLTGTLLHILVLNIYIISYPQFSPTSEHLLLAYGRRHSSLLKSVVIDGETTAPIYTILEVMSSYLSFCTLATYVYRTSPPKNMMRRKTMKAQLLASFLSGMHYSGL